MVSKNIDNLVIFKKELGLNYEIDMKYIGLRENAEKLLSFNFKLPKNLIDEVVEYFERFKMQEPISVDIGNTGDIKCYFRGISPVTNNIVDGTEIYYVSAFLQQIKTVPPCDDNDDGHQCVGCGLH